MQKKIKQRDFVSRTGTGMIVVAWIVFLVLLYTIFDDQLLQRNNPNQNIVTTVNGLQKEVVSQCLWPLCYQRQHQQLRRNFSAGYRCHRCRHPGIGGRKNRPAKRPRHHGKNRQRTEIPPPIAPASITSPSVTSGCTI